MAEGKQRIRYVGPYPAVELTDAEGTLHVVERGKDKAFAPDLAKSLLEQPENWQPSGKKGED